MYKGESVCGGIALTPNKVNGMSRKSRVVCFNKPTGATEQNLRRPLFSDLCKATFITAVGESALDLCSFHFQFVLVFTYSWIS